MSTLSLASRSGDQGFMILVILIIGVVSLLYAAHRRARRKENLDLLARRLGGSVTMPLLGNPRLEFEVDGVAAILTHCSGGRNRPPHTRVRFHLVPAGTLRIVPEGVFASFRKLFGAQDIEVGDAAFDSAFLIQGGPEAWVREQLTPELRRRITALSSLGATWGNAGVSLDAGPGGVSLRCDRNFIDDRRQILAFLEQAMAIFRHLGRPASPGIRILSAEEHADRGDCPVCASALEGRLRRCAGCGTSHHADCWDYFGGCAIYACGCQGGRRA